jgi:hypothetical protein
MQTKESPVIQTTNPNTPALIAWQVRENKRSGKSIWTRVGAV